MESRFSLYDAFGNENIKNIRYRDLSWKGKGKPVFLVREKDQGLTGGKVDKTFWFGDLFIFLRKCIYRSSQGCKVLN